MCLLPKILKLTLLGWPLIGVHPFIGVFIIGIANQFFPFRDKVTSKQISSITKIALVTFLLAVAFGFLLILAKQHESIVWSESLEVVALLSLLGTYIFMVFKLFQLPWKRHGQK